MTLASKLRDQVAADVSEFFDAFDNALGSGSETDLKAMDEAADRLMRSVARARIEAGSEMSEDTKTDDGVFDGRGI